MITASPLRRPPPDLVQEREVERIVAEVDIPPCPAILTAMLRESRKDDPDFTAIGRLLAGDVGLAAALLKTVNSPFYGLPTRATSVQQALALLGLRNVVRLVTGLLLLQAFPVARNEVMKLLWENASRMAACIARLASELRCAERDAAYTFGLFRDCGMLLMTRKYGDYATFYQAYGFPHAGDFAPAESARYFTSHCQVGAHMARNWFLPDELSLAVRHHHDLPFLAMGSAPVERSAATFVALGMVVDAALAIGAGDPVPASDRFRDCPQALALLGIADASALESAVEAARECAAELDT